MLGERQSLRSPSSSPPPVTASVFSVYVVGQLRGMTLRPLALNKAENKPGTFPIGVLCAAYPLLPPCVATLACLGTSKGLGRAV